MYRILHRGSRMAPLVNQQIRLSSDVQDKIKYGPNFVQPRSKPRMFLTEKFLEFVESYENLMKKHTPTLFGVYNSLGTGTKLLYRDIQTYLTLSKDLRNGTPVSALSWRDLELYYKVPRDITHVAPTLLICAMPMTNYVIFPLLYAFPKQLLSSQFWTERQRRYFELENHLKRVQHHEAVLSHFEKISSAEDSLKANCLDIIAKLRSGSHPTVKEILGIKPLFQDGHVLALHNISYLHLRSLSLSQGLPFGGVMPYGKLWRFGGVLWEMDRALVREGSLGSLTDDELVRCCLMRGFNPLGASRTEAEDYLDKWLAISLQLKERELSLLLHAPILLAFNHRANFGVPLLQPTQKLEVEVNVKKTTNEGVLQQPNQRNVSVPPGEQPAKKQQANAREPVKSVAVGER